MSATDERFREPDADPAWRDPVLVVCPRCGGRAVVSGDRRASRLVCEACGLARDWHGERLHVVVDGVAMVVHRAQHGWVDPATGRGVPAAREPQGVDARFGTPLWLRSECCGGELLWATNAAHLDYLGARLRDHAPGPAPLSARLPAWLTSAKNRDEVLRHLARLRRRLDA